MAHKPQKKSAVLAKVQEEMALQLTRSGAPEEVHLFLMRDWVRLLTGIYLAHGNQNSDWKAGWETAHALLWSLAPKRGLEESGALLRMLPTLLSRLHAGCNALGMPLGERDALFERMAMLHAAVAREGLQTGANVAGAVPDEKEASSESDLRNLNAPDLPTAGTHITLPRMKLGDRVAFGYGDTKRLRLLTWISPMGGMYLFADEQGLDAVTLTHAHLAAKFQAGEASLLPTP